MDYQSSGYRQCDALGLTRDTASPCDSPHVVFVHSFRDFQSPQSTFSVMYSGENVYYASPVHKNLAVTLHQENLG